jgi:hypothetical protein
MPPTTAGIFLIPRLQKKRRQAVSVMIVGPAVVAGVARMLFHFRIASNTITHVSTNIMEANQHMSCNENCSAGGADGIFRHQPNTLSTPAVSTVTTTKTNGMPVHNA